MEIGEKFYAKDRRQWRTWLRKNHRSASEIWLVYYKKNSGKPRIPYNDSVEEALCYGWIDSTLKPIDGECYAQRFSPRRKNSFLSELNKERVRRLVKNGKMTSFGLESIKHHMEKKSIKSDGAQELRKFKLPKDIIEKLKSDPVVWRNFQKFPQHYKHIRIGWIDASRHRPEIFKTRLQYFIKMTAKNKKFGMVQ
jgi:uncharacterized protein YdeI (YjbR/CyaY-like superfamily)